MMKKKGALKIKALEERRKQNYPTTKPDTKQKKKLTHDIQDQTNFPIYHPHMFYNNFPFYHHDVYTPFNYQISTSSNSSHTPFYSTDTDTDNDTNFFDDNENLLQVEIETLEQENDEVSGVMLRLPFDIFLDIISRLPIPSLARCRSVCKTWRKLVHHSRFTSMHIANTIRMNPECCASILLHVRFAGDELRSAIHLLEYEKSGSLDCVNLVKPRFYPLDFEFEVVGSCNGLICLSEQFYYDPIYVCNPVIGEYVKLPEASKRTNFDIVSGFGYDEVSNVYKVIRMLFESIDYVEGNASFKLEAEIYTLGTGVWRKLGDVSYPLRGKSSSVFVHGALHWMTDDYIGLNVSELIISFNISREEFVAIPPPPGVGVVSEAFRLSLGDLRRFLCLFDFSSNDLIEIWVMKDYGVKGSWAKEYVISRQELRLDSLNMYPLKFLETGELLLVENGESLVCYYPKWRSLRKIRTHKLPARFEAITHVESFVSLTDIIGPTTSKRSINNRRWYRTLYPLPSHSPELDIEDWILDYEVQQLAAVLDSGVALSDMYRDW